MIKACLCALISALLACNHAIADDSALGGIRSALLPLRPAAVSKGEPQRLPFNYAGPHQDLRGATPALMTVKHSLRDWIESRLALSDEQIDTQALSIQLNGELRDTDLLCEAPGKARMNRCSTASEWQWNGIGYLQAIRLDHQQFGKILIVRTAVGILCGSDESAYAYEWRDKKWRRFWQSEQEIQPGKVYTPQYLYAVNVSWPDEKARKRLILSLGSQGWCSSNFYDVYYRLWQTQSDNSEPKLLLDNAQFAYLGQHDPPIIGSVGSNDALIEFRIPSLDPGVHSYETVRHYRVDGDKLVRIDPLALSPRDFTEDWLRASWDESANWTSPNAPPTLKVLHEKVHADYIGGEYIDDTHHCQKDPAIWEVGVDFHEKGSAYFLVRWQPPYYFEMVDISEKPRPDCDQPDTEADAEHTLFPTQEYR
jgi:hypothetical protein